MQVEKKYPVKIYKNCTKNLFTLAIFWLKPHAYAHNCDI